MSLFFFFFLVLSLSSPSLSSSISPAIGVTYRPNLSGHPPSDAVTAALTAAGVSHVLLHDPDPPTLRSFLYSDISLLLHLPLATATSSPSASRRWISDHLLPFQPRLKVAAIALATDHPTSDLFSTIDQLRSACSDLGLPTIPISTIHSFNVLDPAFPPSAARFRENLTDSYIRPLLRHLSSTRSPFLIDLFPFDLYRSDHNVPVGFAMFEPTALGYRDDPGSGLRYRNLFDMMVDATLVALERAGHRRLKVVVSGTGWPSGGGGSSATVKYAQRYNRGLVGHLRAGIGTPMKRNGVTRVYVRQLFDEMPSRGLNWGIWHRNLSAKYELDLSRSAGGGGGGGALMAVVVNYLIWMMISL